MRACWQCKRIFHHAKIPFSAMIWLAFCSRLCLSSLASSNLVQTRAMLASLARFMDAENPAIRSLSLCAFLVLQGWQSQPESQSMHRPCSSNRFDGSIFMFQFSRFTGSLARILISRSLGPPKHPLVMAMAKPSKASQARQRMVIFMRQMVRW